MIELYDQICVHDCLSLMGLLLFLYSGVDHGALFSSCNLYRLAAMVLDVVFFFRGCLKIFRMVEEKGLHAAYWIMYKQQRCLISC